jgi:hypothetical protein
VVEVESRDTSAVVSPPWIDEYKAFSRKNETKEDIRTDSRPRKAYDNGRSEFECVIGCPH